jgi:CBS domain-containing protein
LQKMIDTRNKSFPVVDGARVVGVVAREDVMRALRSAAAGQLGIEKSTPWVQ